MAQLPIPMTDDSLMPFGKHKGKKMANVPAYYLMWLWENADNLRDPLKSYIEKNLDVIKDEIKKSQQKKSANR
jgi:hypothetical protein